MPSRDSVRKDIEKIYTPSAWNSPVRHRQTEQARFVRLLFQLSRSDHVPLLFVSDVACTDRLSSEARVDDGPLVAAFLSYQYAVQQWRPSDAPQQHAAAPNEHSLIFLHDVIVQLRCMLTGEDEVDEEA